MKKAQKGFTLIELLVVIAIIAILSIVVILTLNPAELLRQARDSNRISDLSTLRSAVSLYLADVSSPVIASATPTCWIANSAATSGPGVAGNCFSLGFVTATGSAMVVVANTSRAVNGTGWLPVNFSAISSGAPIGSLPIDPSGSGATSATLNNGQYYAWFATSSNLTFKLATRMESVKYGFNGASDVVSTDGGNNTSTYEVGTNLAL